MSDKIQARSGVGLGTLLTVLFVGLKLSHVISWSWWWVLAPLWLPLAVVFGVVGVMLLLALLVSLIAAVVSYVNSRR